MVKDTPSLPLLMVLFVLKIPACQGSLTVKSFSPTNKTTNAKFSLLIRDLEVENNFGSYSIMLLQYFFR